MRIIRGKEIAMKKQPVQNVRRLVVTRSIDGVKSQAERYLNLEEHPRQKHQDYPPIILTPLSFL